MYIYYITLIYILVSSLVFRKNRKKFLISTVIVLMLVSGLRSSEIGIDLQLHYAKNFSLITNSNWNSIANYIGGTKYDIGYVVLCKLLGCISTDVQWFIFASSLMFYISYGRYLYRHSDSVLTDVFMFYTSFVCFMFMNIIAQSLAIAVLLWGVDYLSQKKYVKYAIVVLIASTIHNTAIIAIIFILLDFLPAKRKYIIGYIISISIFLLGIDKFLPFIVNLVFSQYSWYLKGNIHGQGVSVSTFGLMCASVYAVCIAVAVIFIYLRNGNNKEYEIAIKGRKKEIIIEQLNTNFLMYMAITAFTCRLLVFNIELAGRLGYYFNLFSFSLLGRAISEIRNRENRLIVCGCVGLFMVMIFFMFGSSAGKLSYGVVPYKFFGE